ncbi:probable receptor-like protein kinase At2g23200 [Chenopodium quinoa]|uniref:probable receptor-like protein kinase At2g23200 n=1 Tax=Chenopodium quinoa TaxID=63459 RepID=UPI000B77111C|nr:probable receptor-like protein kinase At2g23200 [Chenopodium quinoa]
MNETKQSTSIVIKIMLFLQQTRLNPCTRQQEFSKKPSTYDFVITQNGKNAKNCSSNTKEFILNINDVKDKFKIYFVPTSSSIAFVNAIEIVFSINSNITEDTGPRVTPAGSLGNYNSQQSKVLETLYRINVGGPKINGSSSTLWRSWMPDDQYLINKGDAENKTKGTIDNGPGQTTNDFAPLDVYETAKIPKNSSSSGIIPNLTWQFSANKGNRYFIRVHFCDILSPSAGEYRFNLYIYSNYSQVMDMSSTRQFPFYKDYVVESDALGFINISVGPRPNDTFPDKTFFFLNGLEIMQIMNVTDSEPSVTNDSHLVFILSASAVFLILVLAAVFVFIIHQKRKRKKQAEAFEWGNLLLNSTTSSHNRASDGSTSHTSTHQNLQLGLVIPLIEIRRVTNNFDASLIIGEGGFGKVYKGTIKNGLKVAVKRGSSDHGQGIAEFETEIMILSKIRHRHLVSLIGYCCENGEMILVYEFMEKGTLRYHLYDSKHSPASSTHGVLSWNQRLKICIEAAKGLQYLHVGTNKGIIHRDVKSTNILLDENYVAKVADFGLSRSGYLEQTHVSISDVKGTLGYLDPEYITCLQLTEKSDVYAFGVVLFEVLCARPVIDQSVPKEQISLPDWAIACFEEGQLEKIIDPCIAGEIEANSLMKFFEVAQKCLKRDSAERPPMSDVCWGLEYALQLQKAATEKVLQDDSTTDASFNMSFPAVQRFPSQSIADNGYEFESSNTGTGEVFSQLTVNEGTGR